MQRVVYMRKLMLALAVVLATGFLSLPRAEAASSVTVKNETGYLLETVKYVKEEGKAKRVMGQTQALANGGSYTFNLPGAGSYRVYASLRMGGQLKYAKGNAYSLRDGTRARLTLLKVVSSSQGSSISFINKDEFDGLR
ncbi:MAG: hypothetical protein FJ128_11535 [Deltaproteobacteria bacterium]|nr:hypothetical protein [Deltaproteobacteria bacterium]